jgi:protein O-GlcNAc transferase
MGVPTVTLAGNSLVSRQGETLMRCVGLEDWIARNEQEYVEIAVARANELEALAGLRGGLRARARTSPLFDATRFARNLETAFEAMARAKAQGI